MFGAERRMEFSYKAQGPVVAAYIRDKAQRSFIMGPLGSSKTNGSCWKAFRVMIDQEPDREGVRRTRQVAIRNTYGDLLTTTAKDWLDMFEPLGVWREGGREPPSHTLDFMLPPEVPGASGPKGKPTRVIGEMIFLALDREEHVKKLRGLQLTAGMLSEVKELPFAVIQMLDLRIGRFPQGETGPTWYGIFGDTNASDTDHWYYRMAEEKRPEGWNFHRQPGGVIRDSVDAPWRTNPDAENLRNLPLGYYAKGAEGKDEDWIKVNLANEYGFVRDGKPVYPNYRDAVMCQTFNLVKELGIFVGLDFGLTPAALIGQRTLAGQWRYRHELVTEDTGILRFGDELNLFMQQHYAGWPINGIYGDPAGDQRQGGDAEERTAFQLLKSKDIIATPAPGNNDFALRTEAFAAPMTRLIDGEPGMLIHPDCVVTRKGLQGGYAYKRIRVVGSDRFRDMPDKNKYSHPCFVAGTLIDTPRGALPIEVLQVGDLVDTPIGPRRIAAAMHRPAEVFTLATTHGEITCTQDHPFYTLDGFVRADALRYRQVIAGRGLLWKILFWSRRTVPPRNGPSTSSTAGASTGAAGTTRTMPAPTCTALSGRPRTDRHPSGSTSTTSTRTAATTGSPTSNVYRLRPMAPCTWQMLTARLHHAALSAMPSLPPLSGAWPTPSGPAKSPASAPAPCSRSSLSKARTDSPVPGAPSPTRATPISPSAASAAPPARGWRARLQAWMTKIAAAWSAVLHSARTSMARALPARALAAGSSRPATVFNIEVEDAHAYYANGLLVSNCEAGQYLVLGAGEGRKVMGQQGTQRSKDIEAYRKKMGYPA